MGASQNRIKLFSMAKPRSRRYDLSGGSSGDFELKQRKTPFSKRRADTASSQQKRRIAWQ